MYKDCQNLLLHQEILEFDFLHITSLFFEPNINAIEKIELMQNAKLAKIIEEASQHYPKDIIHNYSSHNHSSEK